MTSNSLDQTATYLYALQQNNLVYNSDFRYFSNRRSNYRYENEYGIPDGWLYEDSGSNGSINLDTRTNNCIIIKSQDYSVMSFRQYIQEFPRWKTVLLGNTITVSATFTISSGDADVSLEISDGIRSKTSSYAHQGSIEIQEQFTISQDASSVSLTLSCATPGATLSISQIAANLGAVCLPNLPCIIQGVIGECKQYIATESAPSGEFSICEPSEELGRAYTRLNAVLNGRYGIGANGRSLLPDMRGYFSRAWDNGAGVDAHANNRSPWGEGNVSGDHVGTAENISAGSDGSSGDVPNISELYTIKWA